ASTMCLSCSKFEARNFSMFGSSSTIRILPIWIAPSTSLSNGISRQSKLDAQLLRALGRQLQRVRVLARAVMRDRQTQARFRRLRGKERLEDTRAHTDCSQ